MSDIRRKILTCGVAAACAVALTHSASAMSLPSQASIQQAAPDQTTDVAWRGWGWGPALGLGLAAGALTAGAVAASGAYWGYPYGYGYGPGPGYVYAPGYAPAYSFDVPYEPAYGYAYQGGFPYAWGYGEPGVIESGVILRMRPGTRMSRGKNHSRQVQMQRRGHAAGLTYARQVR